MVLSSVLTPEAPTAAAPGTAEKVAVLEARAAAGLELWHPLDAGALEGRIPVRRGHGSWGAQDPLRRLARAKRRRLHRATV